MSLARKVKRKNTPRYFCCGQKMIYKNAEYGYVCEKCGNQREKPPEIITEREP